MLDTVLKVPKRIKHFWFFSSVVVKSNFIIF